MEVKSAIILCLLFGMGGILFGWALRGIASEKPDMVRCKKCSHLMPQKYYHKFCPICGEKDQGVFEIWKI